MLPISTEGKTAFNPPGARSVFWSVHLEMVNNDAVEELAVSATEDEEISRLNQVKDRQTEGLAFQTFENLGFPLDGSGMVPPRLNEAPDAQVGLIMNTLSGQTGVFATPQTLTGQTIRKFNLIAITLAWGQTVAEEFRVDWYDGAALRHTENIVGNTKERVLLPVAVPNVNRITVQVFKTQIPVRRARIVECLLGAVLVYDGQNSDSLELEENVDLLNERTPANKLRLLTDNFSRDFNLFDPTGIYAYFQTRMLMEVKIGARKDGQTLELDAGKYYLKAPELKGNLSKLQLEATDILGVLQDTLYSKGTLKTAVLSVFVDEVAADAGVTCLYPGSFSGLIMTAGILSMPHVQALRLIAQATNTVLYANREGAITFLPPGTAPLQTIGALDYRMEGGFSPSDDVIINTVDVEASAFSVESTSTELLRIDATGTVTSGLYYADNAAISTSAGEVLVKYEPSVDQTAAITGGKLIVTGRKIVKAVSAVSRTVRQAGDAVLVYEIKDNPFIQAVNAASVADYQLQRKATKRRTVKVEYPGYPYLEMGDIIDFEHTSETTQPFCLTRNALKLGGGMTGSLEARER